jgi:hypothetical protein
MQSNKLLIPNACNKTTTLWDTTLLTTEEKSQYVDTRQDIHMDISSRPLGGRFKPLASGKDGVQL